jgi:sugar lactone lactonase YvrE
MTEKAEQITASVAYHAEGPVWVDRLHWVDMLAGDVLSLGPDGTVDRRHVGSVVAALRPRTSGGFVYAVERGFALDDGVGTPVRALPELWTTDAVRMNEGGCDPDGRFYCGSMAYDETPGAASLYRLDPDGSVTAVMRDLTVSNGLEWSPDGRLAYYVDSATGRIDVLDYERERGLTNRRPFVVIETGAPDGLTVDAEGGIWVAIWGGGAVHRYTPEGLLSEVIELPATQVTACTFGGADLDVLFITTSREGLPASDEPAAGALFRVRPGVAGRPVRPFGG